VSVGDKGWVSLDDIHRLEKDGLISIRLEEVPCAPMGDRTPPIRHCSLTELGSSVVNGITHG
jgi:hypothetical protein